MEEVWTKFEINELDILSKKVTVHWSTNDDNDDGYPDGKITEATFRFDDLDKALKFAGKSRTGFYGKSVDVFLNGKKI